MRVINLLLILLFASAFSVKAGPSVGVLKTANYGHILAKLFYIEEKGGNISNPRVKIIRDRRIAFDKVIKIEGINAFKRISPPSFIDLNNDWEPEVIIEISSDKNNCCNYTLIYSYDQATRTYNFLPQNWGGFIKGRKLEDIDKDGTPEFVSKDIRFANEHGDIAGSRMPIQIWHYQKGKMIDVTRGFPSFVKDDALKLWSQFAEARKIKRHDIFITQDTLRAYLADKYLLGEGQDGWKLVKEAYKGKATYFENLKNFLEKTGYAK